jgi:hypothetical protein
MYGRFVRFSSWADLRQTLTLVSPAEPSELYSSFPGKRPAIVLTANRVAVPRLLRISPSRSQNTMVTRPLSSRRLNSGRYS